MAGALRNPDRRLRAVELAVRKPLLSSASDVFVVLVGSAVTCETGSEVKEGAGFMCVKPHPCGGGVGR